jgi:hypothetical protein
MNDHDDHVGSYSKQSRIPDGIHTDGNQQYLDVNCDHQALGLGDELSWLVREVCL